MKSKLCVETLITLSAQQHKNRLRIPVIGLDRLKIYTDMTYYVASYYDSAMTIKDWSALKNAVIIIFKVERSNTNRAFIFPVKEWFINQKANKDLSVDVVGKVAEKLDASAIVINKVQELTKKHVLYEVQVTDALVILNGKVVTPPCNNCTQAMHKLTGGCAFASYNCIAHKFDSQIMDCTSPPEIDAINANNYVNFSDIEYANARWTINQLPVSKSGVDSSKESHTRNKNFREAEIKFTNLACTYCRLKKSTKNTVSPCDKYTKYSCGGPIVRHWSVILDKYAWCIHVIIHMGALIKPSLKSRFPHISGVPRFKNNEVTIMRKFNSPQRYKISYSEWCSRMGEPIINTMEELYERNFNYDIHRLYPAMASLISRSQWLYRLVFPLDEFKLAELIPSKQKFVRYNVQRAALSARMKSNVSYDDHIDGFIDHTAKLEKLHDSNKFNGLLVQHTVELHGILHMAAYNATRKTLTILQSEAVNENTKTDAAEAS